MTSSDGSASERSGAPGSGLDIVREESRYVVAAQLQTLRETDKKAMATARVDALIVGLLLSAGSLADSPAHAVNWWMVVGSSLVMASLACAVLTYSVDRPSYGLGPGFIDEVATSDSGRVAVERET